MKQYVICQIINGEKYLAAYAETKQEAIEKAELLGLRTEIDTPLLLQRKQKS